MREIKFRAWDGKRMYSPILQDGRIHRNYMDYENDIDYTDIIMQYIGLKDCEETEIYEEDIIEITWADGKTKKRYKVSYFEEGAFFELENLEDKDDFDTFCGWSQSQLKVLGNVYQNTKLLKIK